MCWLFIMLSEATDNFLINTFFSFTDSLRDAIASPVILETASVSTGCAVKWPGGCEPNDLCGILDTALTICVWLWWSHNHSFIIINFYWNIVALQCCVHFYCTAKWISYMFTYISLFFGFLSHLGHHRA